jgi:hypothetical protein
MWFQSDVVLSRKNQECMAHNLKVVGSNPTPATIYVGLIPNSFSCVTAVHSRTLFA